eukprot:Gregarina_sp_Poly_1__4248@NODE_2315_length_2305_cov_28_268543_g1482_i0_p1_GENE_NODE_2315_length_2305_cov_28_268543_g1482_i0NODE_2315_length_2305_cov_28_268543_g1482_i0_p1_ORF_typecomplete_len123_score15_32_NODE_2315_length_2305_cov_28_268543_g1482_i0244612
MKESGPFPYFFRQVLEFAKQHFVFQISRILGKNFDSDGVRKINDLGFWKIVEDPNKKPITESPKKAGVQRFAPKEISSTSLTRIMETNAFYYKWETNAQIKGAGITVPVNKRQYSQRTHIYP